MTRPSKFWLRLIGVLLMAGSFAVMYGLDNGVLTMSWSLRLVGLIGAVYGARLIVYGVLWQKKDESEGAFPFWRKK